MPSDDLTVRKTMKQSLTTFVCSVIHRRIQEMRWPNDGHQSDPMSRSPTSTVADRATPSDSLQLPAHYAVVAMPSVANSSPGDCSAENLQIPLTSTRVRRGSLFYDMFGRSQPTSRRPSREKRQTSSAKSSLTNGLLSSAADSLRNLSGNMKRCRSFNDRAPAMANRRKVTVGQFTVGLGLISNNKFYRFKFILQGAPWLRTIHNRQRQTTVRQSLQYALVWKAPMSASTVFFMSLGRESSSFSGSVFSLVWLTFGKFQFLLIFRYNKRRRRRIDFR